MQVLRIGKISSVNYQNGTARVTYEDRGDNTTNELPFLAWMYWMPNIGDRVLVGALTNGATAAVILGPVWHSGHRPAAHGAGLYRQEMGKTPGEAYNSYDSATGMLLLSARNICFISSDDNISTTLADIVQRIAAIEQQLSGDNDSDG